MTSGPRAALLLVLLVLGGCLQAPPSDDVEAAATTVAPSAPTSVREHPRVIEIPAGDSTTIVRVQTTADDMSDLNGEKALLLAHETGEDAEYAAMSLAWLNQDGTTLRPWGSHISMGGGGGGGSVGRAADPEELVHFALVTVVGATDPFELLLGVNDWGDFEIEGEPIAADVVRTDPVAHLSAYFEFGTPFDLLFPYAMQPVGFEARDDRIHAPPGTSIATGAGALSLTFDHPAGGPGVHSASFFATTFQGARAATWSVEHAIDGEATSTSGFVADPVSMAWWEASTPIASSSGGRYDLFAAVETFPITIAEANTVLWDIQALGLEMDADEWSLSPAPIVRVREECLSLETMSFSQAACHVIR